MKQSHTHSNSLEQVMLIEVGSKWGHWCRDLSINEQRVGVTDSAYPKLYLVIELCASDIIITTTSINPFHVLRSRHWHVVEVA
nr:hypothetical protein HmN_000852400 [Hymenolepis microstoma]